MQVKPKHNQIKFIGAPHFGSGCSIPVYYTITFFLTSSRSIFSLLYIISYVSTAKCLRRDQGTERTPLRKKAL